MLRKNSLWLAILFVPLMLGAITRVVLNLYRQ